MNCNGLNDKIKAKRVLSVLLKSQVDIIYLQESHWRNVNCQIFNTKKFSTQLLAAGTSKSRGVAILLSSRLAFEIIDSLSDPDRRYLFANVHVEEEVLTLATLYAPNSKPSVFLSWAAWNSYEPLVKVQYLQEGI